MTNKKEIKKLGYTIILGFILTVFILLLYVYNYNSDYENLKIEDKLKGYVMEHSSYQGFTFVKLYDGRKIRVPDSRNQSYDEYQFMNVIEKKDSIIKNAYSDTIFIKRKNEKFYFNIINFY
jgi:hypothetical protein